jgi:hypothetical protein
MPNLDRLRQKESDHDGGKKQKKNVWRSNGGSRPIRKQKWAGINPKAGEAPAAEESNSLENSALAGWTRVSSWPAYSRSVQL